MRRPWYCYSMSRFGWRSVLAAAGACVGCAGASPSLASSAVAVPAAAQRGQAVLLDPAPTASAEPVEPAVAPSTQGSPGWLGVALSAQPADRPGVLVSSVLRRSPADLSGLAVGDVVIAVDDQRVNDPADLSRHIAALGAGRRASFMIQRSGADRLFAVE